MTQVELAGDVRLAVADGICRLTLDAPPLNVLTRDLLARLRAHLQVLTADGAVRVVVLAAEGRHFSAGADVGEHLPPTFREMIPEFTATVALLYASPVPLIAAVRGKCLGGGFELVQAADIVVAGEGATFGQPEIALGVFPPAACALLPALAGPSAAAELILTGDLIPASRALALGLVARVVPDDRVEGEAMALAARVARHSAASLRSAKRALRAGRVAATDLAAAAQLYLEDLMRTDDAVEGLRAFLEKRPPAWAHR
jgi:cyclohexa-1,5-dienecarbonyl-CoA hydratase